MGQSEELTAAGIIEAKFALLTKKMEEMQKTIDEKVIPAITSNQDQESKDEILKLRNEIEKLTAEKIEEKANYEKLKEELQKAQKQFLEADGYAYKARKEKEAAEKARDEAKNELRIVRDECDNLKKVNCNVQNPSEENNATKVECPVGVVTPLEGRLVSRVNKYPLVGDRQTFFGL